MRSVSSEIKQVFQRGFETKTVSKIKKIFVTGAMLDVFHQPSAALPYFGRAASSAVAPRRQRTTAARCAVLRSTIALSYRWSCERHALQKFQMFAFSQNPAVSKHLENFEKLCF